MRIAILYICTGKYDVFWRGFYESFENKFIIEANKEYFVFTDAKHINYEEKDSVHKIYQKDLGWPGNTLKRYSIFLNVEEELKKFDYIFFFNANARCCSQITGQEILPDGEKKLVVVKHPGYFNKERNDFPYDRNEKCLAYIPYDEGEYYVCGGINGGVAEDYLKLIRILAQRIEEDEQNRIVAKWHDESHINRYVFGRNDVRILTPSYCFPEDSNIEFDNKIMVLDKSKYINVDHIKKVNKQLPLNIRIKVFAKRVLHLFGINIR